MKSIFPILLAFLLAGCSNSITPELENVRTTNIQFSLPEDSHVNLWVENSYQTTVKVLVDEFKETGTYTVPLEMIDEQGDPLPEGIYTYFIKTNEYIVSKVIFYATQNSER